MGFKLGEVLALKKRHVFRVGYHLSILTCLENHPSIHLVSFEVLFHSLGELLKVSCKRLCLEHCHIRTHIECIHPVEVSDLAV